MSVRTLMRKIGFGCGLGALLIAGAAIGHAATQPDGLSFSPAPTLPAAAAPASPDFPDAALSRNDQDDLTILRLDGIITPGAERGFVDALHALPARRPLVIELSSPGGFTAAGYRMIDAVLAERQSGRPVATRVRDGESCESMCVGLYLAGYPRYAAPRAEFMVHAPRMAENGRMTMRSTQMMVDRLVSLGASPGWIRRVTAEGGFSGAHDHRETADRLSADGANIVTDLLR
ncbi:hypothetical protein AZL_a02760 (plasmid) [Azospirillum sp. B510]|uniref:ATP-dependent Clp protease proteolytic subunit n=1 Tax=Azospirillum sp. (strain B510) TaxID=137722 RepID=UPI0001C4BA66|nr:ATP-dependent Clp protease proteolytic subunit [Azospirillum sp. B510]BAI73807.1 hypothetical protein AZL_a02760 [Azospirillum sp. B510]